MVQLQLHGPAGGHIMLPSWYIARLAAALVLIICMYLMLDQYYSSSTSTVFYFTDSENEGQLQVNRTRILEDRLRLQEKKIQEEERKLREHEEKLKAEEENLHVEERNVKATEERLRASELQVKAMEDDLKRVVNEQIKKAEEKAKRDAEELIKQKEKEIEEKLKRQMGSAPAAAPASGGSTNGEVTSPDKEPVYVLSKAYYEWNFETGPHTGCDRRCQFGNDHSKSSTAAAFISMPENGAPNKAPGQKAFAFSLESPANYPAWQDANLMSQFDFTFHYRYDADVPLLGQVKDFMPHPKKLNNLPNFDGLPFLSWEERKDKEILSVVISNCAGRNGREAVLNRLQQAGVSLASYGACLHNKNTPPTSEFPPGSPVAKLLSGDKFRQKEGLASLHLFHFAAENSDCDHYHTEKLFQALRVGAVPVYMGGKTITDYVPPGSIIDVRDFATPELLADYLKKVAADKNLYMQYHAWRTRPLPFYVIDKINIGLEERTPEWYCKVCRLVRSEANHRALPDTSCEPSRY
eukprot:comp23620_c0_seq1/m.40216 comp23620_c0_seq1/g.40216  ORF comp23620_c0_seq1/g.40216 comp23620_c0_seq1/m.40216 type:complete len:523 (-) comp23620_c0_seq1:139-1707(-)